MNQSPLRWALATAGLATWIATTATSRADGPGTPSQPPPEAPPSQPQVQVQQPQMQMQMQQPQMQQPVPAYRTYQQRRHKQSRWYGWQTLIVDGGWIVGGPVVTAVTPAAGGALLLGGYLVGPPIVHWAHGNIGRGFADLGIRLGAPIVLGTIGYYALHKEGEFFDGSGLAGIAVGGLLGILGAIVIDAAALAYEPADDDDDDAMHRTPRRNALRPVKVTPMFAPRTEGGAVLGVSGTLY